MNLEMGDDLQSPEDADYLTLNSDIGEIEYADDEDLEDDDTENVGISESSTIVMKKPTAIDNLNAKYSLKS